MSIRAEGRAGLVKGWRIIAAIGGLVLLIVMGLVLLRGVMLPFLVGLAAAYVLDPLADRLEAAGLSRAAATFTLTVAFFAALTPMALLLLPVIIEQVAQLALQLPGYLEALRERVARLTRLLDSEGLIAGQDVQGLVARFSERVLGFIGTAAANLVQSSLAVLNLISLIFVTPIVTFYLLRDWDRMVAAVVNVIPPRYLPLASRLGAEIDLVLAGFLRGQGLVCLFLGVFYAVGLAAVGLERGATIGLLTGLFSFIPYVGMLIGVVVGITVAIFQFDSIVPVGLVAAVFALGQFIEGNFLTPRIVGSRIKLHPVWVIFAVLAGTALFGLVGTFLGTPAAAVVAVLIRFAIERWRASPFFQASAAGSS